MAVWLGMALGLEYAICDTVDRMWETKNQAFGTAALVRASRARLAAAKLEEEGDADDDNDNDNDVEPEDE